MHGALGGPVLSILKLAISAGYLTTWPELNPQNVFKLKSLDYAILVHMDQKRKNSPFTREQLKNEDWHETINSHVHNKTCNFFHKFINFNHIICTNQTGKFKRRSKRHHKCIFLTYSYDTSATLVFSMKSRKVSELLTVLQDMHEYLTLRGFKPRHQKLENEISSAVENFLKASKVSFQLVPLHIHCRNVAERVIRTFKNHFITILYMVH